MRVGNRDTSDFSHGRHHAIIDIGSNTVRLVIYGGSWRAPSVLLNEKVAARLGADLAETGRLGEGAMALALGGLARYATLLRSLGVEDVQTVATAAVRDAGNGQEFLKQVRATGLKPRLLSGEEEATTSAMGVLGAFPGAVGVVADLGGGSLELVMIGPEGCSAPVSLSLGTLNLPRLRDPGPEKFDRLIIRTLRKAGWERDTSAPLYLVGGTWRALASYALRSAKSPLDDPHGLELDHASALRLAQSVAQAAPEQLARVQGISAMRATALPHAASLLILLLGELNPTRLVFSSWGLREGLLYQRLDPVARLQDPLLAGVAEFAAPRGGSPSLAARVAGWTVSAVPADGIGSERLRLAATMLALAAMQIEPNLRVRQSIDWALHKRWINLTAEGRAIIATALTASCGQSAPPTEVRELANKHVLKEATGWGFAIRLCSRLGANSLSSLEASALTTKGDRLQLFLGRSHEALHNRGVDKDLARLAEVLGLVPEVRIVPDAALAEERYFSETRDIAAV